jgi:hypothetical protein
MKLYFLSKDNQEKLSLIYERLTGRKFTPPERETRFLKCEGKLEGPAEIAEIMKQKPPYVISEEGRE